ncbi:putative ATP-dependent protease [Sphaerochaeta pleomorpha str. Grapes]|uniref:endopeptidase La n=1 Tax=Sphaerochaeta pleomorpha (strain ATCC BAA-1885 / DSM 22778 / Grapes) TaxID=158190 RepID=G8QQZ6_SPHPG|nr:AAA family ATPase [Sphaerochaeta pleomorpha]AEV29844.1 putative ATP-dependent protease [Sphaerochaeta pleomorpha str. Grapes]
MTAMVTTVKELPYEEACFDFDLEMIHECRKNVSDEGIIGQPRAIRSLAMGFALEKAGYNIFVSGNTGSGRLEAVKQMAEKARMDISHVKDIAYVCNFTQSDSPLALTFSPGKGQEFADAMEIFSRKLVQLAVEKTNFLEASSKLVESLEKQFQDKQIVVFLKHLKDDLIRQEPRINTLNEEKILKDPITGRYRVNLLVNHADTTLRPLVIESHPTFSNLFGSVDAHQSNYHLALHAGSLLEAAGGFIVINAEELLAETGLWDALKRYLDSNALALEGKCFPKGEMRSGGIRPQMAPISVKVILIGSEDTFDTLTEHDERFLGLFKISAQFDYSMAATAENIAKTISVLTRYAEKNNLLPLSDDALSQMLRYSAWFSESRNELATQFSQLFDVLIEADYWARAAGKDSIDGAMILKANDERSYISGISESRINDEILNGEMIISLTGSKTGVVNGLAVMDRGAASFGTPTVISATVAPGNEGIVNIEHEAGLSGEIHDKGLLILEGYLRKHYARTFPLSIYAGIAFEQSYAEVDGDSASSSELYALLSAIGELPIRQEIAVTGSVNQMGMIQPVGGINEKIEGFFRTCQATGLTGKQGVIIPYQNVKNLILPYEILDAIKNHTFHIYPIKTIDEGMQVLSGRPPGKRNTKGNFTPDNFNYSIEDRLRKMYQAVVATRG